MRRSAAAFMKHNSEDELYKQVELNMNGKFMLLLVIETSVIPVDWLLTYNSRKNLNRDNNSTA